MGSKRKKPSLNRLILACVPNIFIPTLFLLLPDVQKGTKTLFLDLDITIDENRFITKLCQKVDDFDFEIVSFPFPTSNMSDHINYKSFYFQLIRFSLVCSKLNDFDIHSRNLLESLLNGFF